MRVFEYVTKYIFCLIFDSCQLLSKHISAVNLRNCYFYENKQKMPFQIFIHPQKDVKSFQYETQNTLHQRLVVYCYRKLHSKLLNSLYGAENASAVFYVLYVNLLFKKLFPHKIFEMVLKFLYKAYIQRLSIFILSKCNVYL